MGDHTPQFFSPTRDSSTTDTGAGGNPGGQETSSNALLSTVPVDSATSSIPDPTTTSTVSFPSSTSLDSTDNDAPVQTASAASASDTAVLSKGTGISSGAIAGAAVGSFFAGLIIAAIAGFLLFRKRNTRRLPSSVAGHIGGANRGSSLSEKAVTVSTVPISPATTGFEFLPQQADDTDVRQKLSTLADQIQLHVENFYQDRPVQMTPELESELSRFETSQLAAPLAASFESSSKPTVLIKHCLAFHIFNLTVAPGRGTQPLLPSELASTVATVYNRNMSSSASIDDVQAFSQWKRLTAYLRPDLFDTNTDLAEQSKTASQIAAHFGSVFQPWAHQQYPEARRSKHLSELIEQAIKTAMWLFSQPDGYRFDWTSSLDVRDRSRGQGNPVVVAPAMLKVSHGGTMLSRPMAMLNTVVKRA